MSYYFAYGSNMNPDRVQKRRMPFQKAFAGTLKGYGLRFNKRSTIYPGAASANVVQSRSEAVQGVVYELDDESSIEFMDPFEGYPIRYDRFWLPIVADDHSDLHAWVYIANQELHR